MNKIKKWCLKRKEKKLDKFRKSLLEPFNQETNIEINEIFNNVYQLKGKDKVKLHFKNGLEFNKFMFSYIFYSVWNTVFIDLEVISKEGDG